MRGHASLRLEGIQHRDGSLWVSGELLDQSLKQGLAGQSISVTVRWQNRNRLSVAKTTIHGRFKIAFRLPRGIYQIALSYNGNGTYAATHVSPTTIDISKEQVDLELRAKGGLLDASQRGQVLLVGARAAGQWQALPLSLQLNKTTLAQETSTESGLRQLAVPTARLGKPGPLTLELHFAGDATRNAAAIRLETLLVTPTQLSLAAKERRIEAGASLTVTGTLRDGLGPISGASVDLDVMGQYLASTATDAQGHYQLRVATTDYPPGPLDLIAHFQPNVTWRSESTSSPLELRIAPHRPISVQLYLIPASLTVFALLVVVVFRYRRQIQALVSRRAGPRKGRGTAPVSTAAQAEDAGVRFGKNTLRGWLNRRYDVKGVVRDKVSGAALADAEIWLSGTSPLSRSDSKGHFHVSGLEPGEHRVVVVRQGYISERFTVTLPHHGAYNNMGVDLLPVRVKLLQLYRDAVATQLPRNDLWLLLTPRELALRIGLFEGKSPLAPLCELLEDTYWGHRPAEERDVPKAEALVAEIVEQMTRSEMR